MCYESTQQKEWQCSTKPLNFKYRILPTYRDRRCKKKKQEKNDQMWILIQNVCSTLAMEAVLRIRDAYPGSRILIFVHPGSQISDPKS
jgi:hypothetical protein